MKFALIGAGGHAKALVEALHSQGHRIVLYVDPRAADWLDARRLADDRELDDKRLALVFGFGATTPRALAARLGIVRGYLARGFKAPPIVHPAASVSKSARLGAGAAVVAGATVMPATEIGVGAIVNTNASVDHDSTVGHGAHVAPGAVVLGGCRIGDCAMVGAGSVLLQGTAVPKKTLVRATSLWRGAQLKKRSR